jgi:aryl-alcohol dehydrogenase-like predicted oxidoreductase
MQYRKLGRTGLKVSELCLGTMQFGWTTNEKSSREVMDAFVDAGGNFLDTADIYTMWGPRGMEAAGAGWPSAATAGRSWSQPR